MPSCIGFTVLGMCEENAKQTEAGEQGLHSFYQGMSSLSSGKIASYSIKVFFDYEN